MIRGAPVWINVLLYGLIIALGIWAFSAERWHARDLVERATGSQVESFHRVMWECAGKARQGFRFTTADHRQGKICVGGRPYRITYDR